MGEDGHVTHFHFSVICGGKGDDGAGDRVGSKIVVVPFDGKAFDEYMAEVVANDPVEEVLPIDASNAADDENVLNSKVYSFEKIGPNVACMWHLQHKDNFIPSTEKVMDGEYAMKYVQNDASVTNDLQIQGSFNSNLLRPAIADGEYEFSVNFWVDDTCPDEVEFPFAGSGKFFIVKFDLSQIERKQWVKLTKKIQIAGFDDPNYKINIIVRKAQMGTFYMDKIELIRTASPKPDTGFGDAQMMGFELEEAGITGADGWWANTMSGTCDYYNRTTEKAHTGEASMLISVPMGGEKTNDAWLQTDDGTTKPNDPNILRIPEAGDYVFRRYVWIEEGCNSSLSQILTFFDLVDPTDPTNDAAGKWQVASIENVKDLSKGEWLKVDKALTFAKPFIGKMIIKLNNAAAAIDEVKVYMDDFQLIPKGDVANVATADKASLTVSAQAQSIMVRFAPMGEMLSVYDLSGTLVASQKVNSANTNIAINNVGTYIVRVNNVSHKVVL